MRVVKLGEHEIELRATPLALLFYRQSFDRDLIADLMGLQELQGVSEGDFSNFDSVLLLQIAYVMHRAAKLETNFPAFEQWLGKLESIDFADPEWATAIAQEAIDGFFRSSRAAGETTGAKSEA